MSDPKKTDETTLESALEKLDALVQEMETGELPLETLISKYEEGVGLAKFCRERLTSAEKRIEIISRDTAGRAILEPFDTESDE